MYKNCKKTIVLGLMLAFVALNPIQADSIVSFADLQFHSDFEKEAFYKLENTSNPDYFALYLAVDKNVTKSDYQTYKAALDVLTAPYKNNSYKKLKDKKKVAKVYKGIHSALLDKYNEKAYFAAMFSNGEYECVTSSMLYSLVFEELGIPYEIEFLPNHVYLTAYPNSSDILVETTNPNKGVFVYDHNFKKNFIEYLRSNKLISKNEYENKSIDDLFTEYYLKTEKAEKKQLVAAQYTNLGLDQLSSKQTKESLNNMLKAYYLYPDTRNKYLLMITLGVQIDKTSASDKKYASYFAMFCQLTSTDINKDLFTNIFIMMTNRQLIIEGDVEMYVTSYKLLQQKINDSTLLSEFAFVYNLQMGDRYNSQRDPFKAQPYIQKAFEIKPGNTNVQMLLVSVFVQQSNAYKNDGENLKSMYQKINGLMGKNDVLSDNKQIINLMYKISLSLVSYYYYENNETEGRIYKEKFEAYCDSVGVELDYETKYDVEKVYSTIAAYYFKRNNNREARKVIEKALVYYPGSYSLNRKLKVLD